LELTILFSLLVASKFPNDAVNILTPLVTDPALPIAIVEVD